ncbi:hypothetical protein [Murimonas intestini]|uniref:Lipoprotein n=1 Tax=Murimonas intestini TaxID=1337051 RepID=A0AB73T1B4_9FIRM|nr:hypothetical protein [Murimonas intestini]MCR1842422.1 hypothetical protein [Murimonas intestini]MCR1867220.1 hypothetical protein [Murimonas intestini]MCR1884406.1 hypothetical protein [Murimonas intestini]
MRKTVLLLAAVLTAAVLGGCNGSEGKEQKADTEQKTEAVMHETSGAAEVIGDVPLAEAEKTEAGQTEANIPSQNDTQAVQETEMLTEKMTLTEAGVPEADWNGTYVKEGESLTMEAVDATSFEFQFGTSGINGVARISENPNSATYEGDDHYMVQFVLSDGQVDVTVLTQDSQSESSPINGLYELKK